MEMEVQPDPSVFFWASYCLDRGFIWAVSQFPPPPKKRKAWKSGFKTEKTPSSARYERESQSPKEETQEPKSRCMLTVRLDDSHLRPFVDRNLPLPTGRVRVQHLAPRLLAQRWARSTPVRRRRQLADVLRRRRGHDPLSRRGRCCLGGRRSRGRRTHASVWQFFCARTRPRSPGDGAVRAGCIT